MIVTTPPSCLRPPPDPPPSSGMYALFEALCPDIPPKPPDPPDGLSLLLVLQSFFSSVVSPSSLAVVVHPTPLLGAVLLCTSETTRPTQPELWLAGSVWFCISEAPTPLHAASDPPIVAENPFCYASAVFISAMYSRCSDTASFTFDVFSFVQKISVCYMCKQSESPFNTRHRVYTFLSSSKKPDGEQFWMNSVTLIRIQYGNIVSQSLCLNSTSAFFSTFVKYIQRVIASGPGPNSGY
ncbi:unnamed protein product [Eruca vesicaria subsp. sativa]|uniref:Uncharacterized protein n=1 Tax=Eruca vesicaria subsp. sativa TaxID=29727 RepID=A0ABC8LHT0_ERUVS|nr:unnamed protein product [Eruca vesicaria subsp. sativa]